METGIHKDTRFIKIRSGVVCEVLEQGYGISYWHPTRRQEVYLLNGRFNRANLTEFDMTEELTETKAPELYL